MFPHNAVLRKPRTVAFMMVLTIPNFSHNYVLRKHYGNADGHITIMQGAYVFPHNYVLRKRAHQDRGAHLRGW